MVCLREVAAHLDQTEYMEASKLKGESGWNPKKTKLCKLGCIQVSRLE